MKLGLYPGWRGIHTRDEAPGAIRNGTRVRKVKTEPSDAHPIGAMATVLGSMTAPRVGMIYFVEWDALPRSAVAVVPWKIEVVVDKSQPCPRCGYLRDALQALGYDPGCSYCGGSGVVEPGRRV